MRIGGPPSSADPPRAGRRTQADSSAPTEDADRGASVVSIRSKAAAKSSAMQEAEVAARLEAVRQQLADGSYEIDFDRLAGSIADDELGRHGI